MRHVERLGADAFANIEPEGLGLIVARAEGEAALRPGQTIWATPQPGRAHRLRGGKRVD